MSRRKVGDEAVRIIQKTGREGESYMITLPKSMVRKLRWQVNQQVTVKLDEENARLIVEDWEK